MKYCTSISISCLCFLSVIESRQFASHTRRKCVTDLTVAWSHEVSTGPFVSSPIIADIDTDGDIDIAVTSFSGDIHVVRGRDGQYRRGAKWPLRLVHDSIYATPLQYDIDHNGVLDLIVCTATGQILFIDADGQLLNTYQLEAVSVVHDWYNQQIAAGQELIHDFVLDDISQAKEGLSYVQLDAHVLASSVLDDLNQDGITEELVIPVSYYLDIDDYSSTAELLPSVIKQNETNSYLVSALVYLNLTTLQPYLTVHLDLTKRSANYPAYLLASPTVLDVHPSQPGLETLIGTAAGRLHMIDAQGHSVEPYPLPVGVVQSQVTVADLNADGDLKVIVQEVGGNVACYNAREGRRLWETEISGVTPLGVRLADIVGDLQLEVVIASDDGQVWALDSTTGEVVRGWPVRVSSQLHTSPLITRLYDLDMTLIVNLGSDGILHLMSADHSCQSHVALGELSLVNILSYDLLPTVAGVELLIATSDGTLLCLVSSNVSDSMPVDRLLMKSVSQPAELRTHNDFSSTTQSLIIINNDAMSEHTSSSFDLELTVIDNMKSSSLPFSCQVLIGGNVLHSMSLTQVGLYTVHITSPRYPVTGHLVLECHTKHGILLHDVTIVRFYKTLLYDLQWLLVTPCLAMSVFILFLRGFPAADILPVTVRTKHR